MKKFSFFQKLVIFEMDPNMNIALKFESNTVCIYRHAFWTYFSCKIPFKSNFQESVQCRTQGGPEGHGPPEEAMSALKKNFFFRVLLKEKVGAQIELWHRLANNGILNPL